MRSENEVQAEVQKAIETVLGDPQKTAWSVLESIRSDDGYQKLGVMAIVAGYMDGFDDTKDKYGENGERLCLKVAFLPEHSMMSQYATDWQYPVVNGEVYDTEISLQEGMDLEQTVRDLIDDYDRYQILTLVEKIDKEADVECRKSLCDNFIDLVYQKYRDAGVQGYYHDNECIYESYLNFDAACGLAIINADIPVRELPCVKNENEITSIAEAWEDEYANGDGSFRVEDWCDMISEDFYIRGIGRLFTLLNDERVQNKSDTKEMEQAFLAKLDTYRPKEAERE